MKQILCFGDSNTFGTNPAGGRWPRDIRWTGRLQMLLSEGYYVIEEGCGGRTTVWEDNLELHKNGRTALPVALASHKPLDLVILMLGTNDCKARFSLLPEDIANGAGELVELVRQYPYGAEYPVPQVLLVSPIEIGKDIAHSKFTGFRAEAHELSRELSDLYRKKAEELNCRYFAASSVAKPSVSDSLHMEAADHCVLANALAEMVCIMTKSPA